ncbi:threonine dehydratase [Thalassospira alkalitolerans]|uniref:threonine dehydratase n=1 Tax=Thalassospira alkalitolerans TaxID=1293890 RepID=UPI0030ED09DD|tara:strand:+ start:45763 stop:46731 length:969 start_codon:yes stop_codon:yes gene_type:complete
MSLFSIAELREAAGYVHEYVPPTPTINWPLLDRATGLSLYVKHENHTRLGAFKIRGGLTFCRYLKSSFDTVVGIISATRGNHGQSLAHAARLAGISATIIVPHGNSAEKNAAMRAWGAEVIEHGDDFQDAAEYAARQAVAKNLVMVPPFHPELVRGVASYGLELFDAVKNLDRIYVPVGMGSGICSLITVRDALGLDTEIIGVVATGADAVLQSFRAGHVIETAVAKTFADGVACRCPDSAAFQIILKGASDIVAVSDEQIRDAMCLYFSSCHTLAEGAGAASLAAAIADRDRNIGKKIAVILTGANIDRADYARVLNGDLP